MNKILSILAIGFLLSMPLAIRAQGQQVGGVPLEQLPVMVESTTMIINQILNSFSQACLTVMQVVVAFVDGCISICFAENIRALCGAGLPALESSVYGTIYGCILGCPLGCIIMSPCTAGMGAILGAIAGAFSIMPEIDITTPAPAKPVAGVGVPAGISVTPTVISIPEAWMV